MTATDLLPNFAHDLVRSEELGVRSVGALCADYTKDYDGMLSIEPHSHFWTGKKGQWAIDYTINYFRPMIMPENYEYEDNPYMP